MYFLPLFRWASSLGFKPKMNSAVRDGQAFQLGISKCLKRTNIKYIYIYIL